MRFLGGLYFCGQRALSAQRDWLKSAGFVLGFDQQDLGKSGWNPQSNVKENSHFVRLSRNVKEFLYFRNCEELELDAHIPVVANKGKDGTKGEGT